MGGVEPQAEARRLLREDVAKPVKAAVLGGVRGFRPLPVAVTDGLGGRVQHDEVEPVARHQTGQFVKQRPEDVVVEDNIEACCR